MAVHDLNPENVDITTGAIIENDKHKEEQKKPVSPPGQDQPGEEIRPTT